MKFTKHNNPSKRRKARKLTENDLRLMDEARALILEAERKGSQDVAYNIAIALNLAINK